MGPATVGLLPELSVCLWLSSQPRAQVVAAGGWVVDTAAGTAQGGLWGHSSWREMAAHDLALGVIKALFP